MTAQHIATPLTINADFSQRVVQRAAEAEWIPSPLPGVTRRMLDRRGGEIARATSVVRYEAGSSFSRHVHGGGEEFFVLDGAFSDEDGDYPAGFYVRNPPGSAHAPSSREGCLLLVKLWQFAADDGTTLRIDTRDPDRWQNGPAIGLRELPLHTHRGVVTSVWRCAAQARVEQPAQKGGAEVFVLEGSLHDALGDYPAGTWLRLPEADALSAQAGDHGALLFLKTGAIGAAEIPLPDNSPH